MIFRHAEIGDIVWDWFEKYGIIIDIDKFDDYPIKVDFNNGESNEYTYEGAHTIGGGCSLFWKEIEIPKEALTKQLN